MRKVSAWILIAAISFCLFGCGSKAPVLTTIAPTVAESNDSEVVILYTGSLNITSEMTDAAAKLEAITKYADALRESGKDVIMIDGGCAGADYGQVSTAIDLLNTAGYAIATGGAAEFGAGIDAFVQRAEENAQFTYLCANVTQNKQPFFTGCKSVEYSTCNVAFIGISCPSFLKDEDTVKYDMYGGETTDALYKRVQIMLDAARADGADYVVLLTNMGECMEEDKIWSPYALIANTEGASVVMDAGTRQVISGNAIINKNNEETVYCSSGVNFNGICEVHINTGTGVISVQTLNMTDVNGVKSLTVDKALHQVNFLEEETDD